MAIVTREQVMNALLGVLQTNTGIIDAFPTISRRFLMMDQLVQAGLLQPALMIYEGMGLGGGVNLFERPARATPARVIINVTLVIYARLPGGGTASGPDSVTPGGTVFNPLLETVIAALAPDDSAQGVLTLGGMVSHCYLKGRALMMTGEIDPTQGQGMATLPLEIMLYPSL